MYMIYTLTTSKLAATFSAIFRRTAITVAIVTCTLSTVRAIYTLGTIRAIFTLGTVLAFHPVNELNQEHGGQQGGDDSDVCHTQSEI